MVQKFILPTIQEEIDLVRSKPFLYWYNIKFGTKELICFGLHHTKDASHIQFNKLKEILIDFNPQCVILEATEDFVKSLKNNIHSTRDEREIICALLENKAMVIGGDLKIRETMMFLPKNKFSEDDILITLLLYQVHARSKKEKLAPIDIFLEELTKENVNENEKILTKTNEYLKIMYGKPLDEMNSKDNIYPIPVKEKCILNKISRKISEIRDNNMLETIETNIKRFDRVIFFAGRNHVIRQENFIKNVLLHSLKI